MTLEAMWILTNLIHHGDEEEVSAILGIDENQNLINDENYCVGQSILSLIG